MLQSKPVHQVNPNTSFTIIGSGLEERAYKHYKPSPLLGVAVAASSRTARFLGRHTARVYSLSWIQLDVHVPTDNCGQFIRVTASMAPFRALHRHRKKTASGVPCCRAVTADADAGPTTVTTTSRANCRQQSEQTVETDRGSGSLAAGEMY